MGKIKRLGTTGLALCAVVLFSLLSGCSSPSLKVGSLHVIDALPLCLAEYKPIFTENNLQVETVYFNDQGELHAALMKGEVDAVITDLVGALLLNEGQERGKIVRVALRGHRDKPLEQTVVFFSKKMADGKPALVRRFLRAYEQSVRELNVRPGLYRSLLDGLIQVPPDVSAGVSIPVFPFPGEVPTESEVELANARLAQEGKSSSPVPYRQAVNGGFLWDPYQFRPAACCGW